jgi:formate hydrogenlyase subunit 3/multisubunit Na+/H+ antiporter MnhD subunit
MTKALMAALPVAVLLVWSILRYARRRTLSAALQLLGSGCLVIVVLAHVAEAVHWYPSMGWGEPHSVGHYTDLTSAVLGVVLLITAGLLSLRGDGSRANTSRRGD